MLRDCNCLLPYIFQIVQIVCCFTIYLLIHSYLLLLSVMPPLETTLLDMATSVPRALP